MWYVGEARATFVVSADMNMMRLTSVGVDVTGAFVGAVVGTF